MSAPMNILSIIDKKKRKQALSEEEIAYFVRGAADGSIPDYQLAAMLMAIRLNGMDRAETAQLTLAMTHSGDVVDLSGIEGIPTDKHSTGGVGDTTTLVLAPLVAACGVPVAKMSGRGLGHTGGTLDKLESIPGVTVEMSMERFVRQVRQIGCAVVGQSGNLDPADKALYALRDVTSTVDSLPLIASSIISKKLASGAKAIVLDVKTGAGAIMHTLEDSIALAQTMVNIGTDAGRNVTALVTDMDEPLGSHIGNALEVKEAIDALSGRARGPLMELSLELATHMLVAGGAERDEKAAQKRVIDALRSGAGLAKLAQLIEAQGGDPRVTEDVSLLPQAPVLLDALAPEAGSVHAMDTTRLGYIAQRLGAGRMRKDDPVDPAVGFVLHARVGDRLEKGQPVATVHARTEDAARIAVADILDAIALRDEASQPRKLIYAVVRRHSIQSL